MECGGRCLVGLQSFTGRPAAVVKTSSPEKNESGKVLRKIPLLIPWSGLEPPRHTAATC